MPTNLPPGTPLHFDSTLPASDRIRHAADDAVRQLIDRGLDAAAAAEAVERHGHRIMAGGSGVVRVQDPSGHSLYPINARNPLEHFVAELYATAPGTAKAAPEPSDESLDAKRRMFYHETGRRSAL